MLYKNNIELTSLKEGKLTNVSIFAPNMSATITYTVILALIYFGRKVIAPKD